MIANTVLPTPTSESSAPTRSSRGGFGSAERGTTRRVPTRAPLASTTFSPKKELHEKNSSRMPLPNRPRTAPPPAIPTQTPMALGRSSGGNDVVITAKVVGMIAAAPSPISARSTISWSGSVVSIPSPAADPNTASPPTSSSRRPNRSPSAPANSSSPANTTV